MKWQRWTTSTPGALRLDDERRDLLRFSLPFTTVVGVRAMTTKSSARVPFVHQSFSPFRMKCVAVLGRRRGRAHVRRIGAGVDFGERERRDRALRQAREEALLLLLGAEELQRLRHADRLVRREQRRRATRPAT